MCQLLRKFNNINVTPLPKRGKLWYQLRLTTSMILHYQNDGNNVEGRSKLNTINDTPLPKRRK